ncbi:MAG: hypothetical protein D4S01_00185, partial [Dehalococcoidia bacterium]
MALKFDMAQLEKEADELLSLSIDDELSMKDPGDLFGVSDPDWKARVDENLLAERQRNREIVVKNMDKEMPLVPDMDAEYYESFGKIDLLENYGSGWGFVDGAGGLEGAPQGQNTWHEKVPFSFTGVTDAAMLYQRANRFKNNTYEDDLKGDIEREYDFRQLRAYSELMEEEAARGKTGWAKLGTGLAHTVPFMVEFGLSGGGTTALKKILEESGEKGLKAVMKAYIDDAAKLTAKAAVKKILKTGAKGVGEWAKTAGMKTLFTSHRAIEKSFENAMDKGMQVTPLGKKTYSYVKKGDSPAVALTKGYLDHFIENFSEEAGSMLFAPLKVAAKSVASKLLPKTARVASEIIERLKAGWVRKTAGRTAGGFGKIMQRGYDGILEEFGEERVGDILRAVFQLQEWSSVIPTGEDALVELGMFAIIGGGMAVFKADAAMEENKLDKKKLDFEERIKNLKKAEQEIVQDFINEGEIGLEDLDTRPDDVSLEASRNEEGEWVEDKNIEEDDPDRGEAKKETKDQGFELDLVKYPPVSMLVEDINVAADELQFKQGGNKDGVTEENRIQADKYNPLAGGNILVWERKDGRRFVVNGHHRRDLAVRTGQKAVFVQVIKESEGISIAQARAIGAEINILEDKGDINDYATFFREFKEIGEKEAKMRGILSTVKGRRGFHIGRFAGDELYALFKGNKISAGKAVEIAMEGRDNPGLQVLGIDYALKGMSAAEIRASMKSAKVFGPPKKSTKSSGGDFLFDFDDSWRDENIKRGKIAAKKEAVYLERRKVLKQAIGRGEKLELTTAEASVLGITASRIKDKATYTNQLEKALEQTELMVHRWSQWGSDTELQNEISTELEKQNPVKEVKKTVEEVKPLNDNPSVVIRMEEPGVKPDVLKPHGLYLNREGSDTGVEPEMTEKYQYQWHPDNVLDVTSDNSLINHARGQGFSLPPSAGIKALRKLLSESEFESLRKAKKEELLTKFSAEYPDLGWDKYFDTYEMLEGYAGLRARDAGYDAIVAKDEVVALRDSAISLQPPLESASLPKTLNEKTEADVEADVLAALTQAIANSAEMGDKPVEKSQNGKKEVKKPVEEVKKPVEEVKKPVEEVKKPVEEVKKPVEEVKKPVETVTIRKLDVDGVPLDKKPILPGDQFKTSTGRVTTLYPNYKRHNKADEKIMNQWLIENAIAEAESRGDEFNLVQFKDEDASSLPPASRQGMNDYMFGDPPAVVKSILKPLESLKTLNEKAEDKIPAGILPVELAGHKIPSGVDPYVFNSGYEDKLAKLSSPKYTNNESGYLRNSYMQGRKVVSDQAKQRSKAGKIVSSASKQAQKELADSVKELADLIAKKGLASTPFADPELIAGTAKVTGKLIKAGVYTFANAMVYLGEALGNVALGNIKPYMAQAWNALRELEAYKHLDKADAVDEYDEVYDKLVGLDMELVNDLSAEGVSADGDMIRLAENALDILSGALTLPDVTPGVMAALRKHFGDQQVLPEKQYKWKLKYTTELGTITEYYYIERPGYFKGNRIDQFNFYKLPNGKWVATTENRFLHLGPEGSFMKTVDSIAVAIEKSMKQWRGNLAEEWREWYVEFMEQLEKHTGKSILTTGKSILTNGGESNGSSTDSDMERDSEESEARNGVDGNVDEDGPGDVDGDAGTSGGTPEVSGVSEQGDSGVSHDSTAIAGESGDNTVYNEVEQGQSEERSSGDTQREGSQSPSEAGISSARSRERDVTRPAVSEGESDVRPVGESTVEQAGSSSELEQEVDKETAEKYFQDFETRLQLQRDAENTPFEYGSLESIKANLPLLYPGQQEDVLKAEKRFADESADTNKGILFTNGTGTGKTFTGLGIIKRFLKSGRENVLIVVPKEEKVNDWIEDAGHVNIDVSRILDTKSKGESGVNVTTYANFYANKALYEVDFDLLVFDESHLINSNAVGKVTSAQRAMNIHSGVDVMPKVVYRHHAEIKKAIQDGKYTEEQMKGRLESLKKGHLPLGLPEKLLKKIEATKQKIARFSDNSKVVFLSATPFAYVKNITYADKYLYDADKMYPQNKDDYQGPYGFDKYLMENFSYRWRYHKLATLEAEVNSSLMERDWHTSMVESGAISGRKLDVPYDYSREFVEVDTKLGRDVQDGYQFAWDRSQEFPEVWSRLRAQFRSAKMIYFLEALKAKEVVPRIQLHLDLGRQVIIYHDRNMQKAENLLKLPSVEQIDLEIGELTEEMARFASDPSGSLSRSQAESKIKSLDHLKDELSRYFAAGGQKYQDLDFGSLDNPINAVRSAYPDAVFLNGGVSKKDRRASLKDFNVGKAKVIVVNSAAGAEGISLHDKVGNAQRVLINLGMPTRPTFATQIEGRIYRLGVMSDAIIEYLTTGLAFEQYAFASSIAERSETAENLALGIEARNLTDAFRDGYASATQVAPHANQGKGGRKQDGTAGQLSAWEKAKTYYFSRQKLGQNDKGKYGRDYFATPEPLGLKMVEWAGIRPGDKVLEPSAGHGAI